MSPTRHEEQRVREASARGADLFLRGTDGPIRLLAHFPSTNPERAPLLVLFTAAQAGTQPDPDRLAETVSQRAATVVLVSAPPRPATSEATVGIDTAATILDWVVDHADQLRADADHLVVAGTGPAACLVVSLVAEAPPEVRQAIRDQVLIQPPHDYVTRLEASAGAAAWDGLAPISTTVVFPTQRSAPDVTEPREHHTWLSTQVVYSDDATSTLIDVITHSQPNAGTTPEQGDS